MSSQHSVCETPAELSLWAEPKLFLRLRDSFSGRPARGERGLRPVLKSREKRTMTRRSRTHLAAPAIAGARKHGVLKSLTVARSRACEVVALGRGISCAAG